MKKIVSNVLVVSTQLIIGGLFLFMLFSDTSGDNEVVAVNNDNLNKMADAVTLLFDAEEIPEVNVLDEEAKKREEELIAAEQRKKEEEEAARKKAEEEAAEKARKEAEEAARKKAEEEAAEKARKEAEAQRAAAPSQSVAALQEYAHDLVINTYGWSEDDFSALVNLWNRESGWGVTVGNPNSGAYGIPQSLPGSKMASEGSDWATNGQTQIRWGLKYIKSTYGSPSAAWNHFLNRNWY